MSVGYVIGNNTVRTCESSLEWEATRPYDNSTRGEAGEKAYN